MKKRITRIVLLCAVALAAAAAVMYRTAPGLDEKYLEETVQKAMKKFSVPAVSLSVEDSDGILYDYYEGVRIAGGEDEITHGDYFHIGSCSKSLLAIIAAKFVEQGLIQWDTPFLKVFPELKGGADENYSEITLDNLLSCRAGIKPYTSGYEEYPDFSGSADMQLDFLKFLLSLPPAAQMRGHEFEHLYSNASYSLASAMLERISGKSYKELIEEFVVAGLGINIAYGWPYQIGAEQPFGHLKDENGELIPFGQEIDYHINPLIAPAGNLSTTSGGFAKLAMLHLDGLRNGNMIGREAWEYIDKEYEGFSLGAYNNKLIGKRYVLLDGTAGTFYARAVILPESDIAFAILMNSGEEAAADYITMRLAKAVFKWWWMFWV